MLACLLCHAFSLSARNVRTFCEAADIFIHTHRNGGIKIMGFVIPVVLYEITNVECVHQCED